MPITFRNQIVKHSSALMVSCDKKYFWVDGSYGEDCLGESCYFWHLRCYGYVLILIVRARPNKNPIKKWWFLTLVQNTSTKIQFPQKWIQFAVKSLMLTFRLEPIFESISLIEQKGIKSSLLTIKMHDHGLLWPSAMSRTPTDSHQEHHGIESTAPFWTRAHHHHRPTRLPQGLDQWGLQWKILDCTCPIFTSFQCTHSWATDWMGATTTLQYPSPNAACSALCGQGPWLLMPPPSAISAVIASSATFHNATCSWSKTMAEWPCPCQQSGP